MQDFKGQRDYQGLRSPEVFWQNVGFKWGIAGDKFRILRNGKDREDNALDISGNSLLMTTMKRVCNGKSIKFGMELYG